MSDECFFISAPCSEGEEGTHQLRRKPMLEEGTLWGCGSVVSLGRPHLGGWGRCIPA